MTGAAKDTFKKRKKKQAKVWKETMLSCAKRPKRRKVACVARVVCFQGYYETVFTNKQNRKL
jgi:hypothetical protein